MSATVEAKIDGVWVPLGGLSGNATITIVSEQEVKRTADILELMSVLGSAATEEEIAAACWKYGRDVIRTLVLQGHELPSSHADVLKHFVNGDLSSLYEAG